MENKLISKEKFIEIINVLRETQDDKNKINDIIRNSINSQIAEFTEVAGLMICHEDIVIELLEKIFNNSEDIEYFIYDLDYGREYKDGCILDANGKIIDISTAEKLYDYLIKSE